MKNSSKEKEILNGEFSKIRYIQTSTNEILAYREAGTTNEEFIVLLHGFMNSSLYWDSLASYLGKFFHILAFDLRGSGHSSYEKPIETINDLADDIASALEKLKINGVTVAGWGTGGAVTMSLAIRFPELVKNVVLINSVGMKGLPLAKVGVDYIPTGEINKTKLELLQDPGTILLEAEMKNKNKEFWKNLFNSQVYHFKPISEEKMESYLEETLLTRNHLDLLFALTIFNISEDESLVGKGDGMINKLTKECLLIHSEENRVINIKDIQETQLALGKLARLVVFKGSSHSVVTDFPEDVAKLVTEFVLKDDFMKNYFN